MNHYISGGKGTYTVTGRAATFPRTYQLTAVKGTFTVTGTAARLGRFVAAATGTYAITGIAAGLKATRLLTAAAGSFALSGKDAGIGPSAVGRVTIGALSIDRNLAAQPFGYDETNTRQGLTARKWQVSGLLTKAQWQSLVSVYEAWRDARIDDPDSVVAQDVGTTINLTANTNGQSWTSVPCWFSTAPSADQVGPYLQASCELVDANQALAVALRSQELGNEDRPALGTFTLGGVVLTLLDPPETYQDTPQMALTATGRSYITGPLTATKVYQVRGTTNATGWAGIQTWFEAAVQARPGAGQLFPISAPSASAANRIEGGLKVIEYTVTCSVAEAR
jgi:hypothetical protein